MSWFAETERLLCRYFRQEMQVERIKVRIQIVRESIRELERELCYIRDIPRLTAKYGVAPGASGTNSGLDDLIARYEEQYERLGEKLLEKRKTLVKLEARLNRVRSEQEPISTVISRLNENEYRLLELRYVYHRSNYAIGDEIGYSESNIRKMHERIIYRLATWLGKSKECVNSAHEEKSLVVG